MCIRDSAYTGETEIDKLFIAKRLWAWFSTPNRTNNYSPTVQLKKIPTTFYCQHCGAHYPKWQGKCAACQEWNTIVEAVARSAQPPATPWNTGDPDHTTRPNQPELLQNIIYHTHNRIACPDKEFNRVLGGGIVPGSLVLIGGEPGIGKSTLLLQIALTLPLEKVLYLSLIHIWRCRRRG